MIPWELVRNLWYANTGPVPALALWYSGHCTVIFPLFPPVFCPLWLAAKVVYMEDYVNVFLVYFDLDCDMACDFVDIGTLSSAKEM